MGVLPNHPSHGWPLSIETHSGFGILILRNPLYLKGRYLVDGEYTWDMEGNSSYAKEIKRVGLISPTSRSRYDYVRTCTKPFATKTLRPVLSEARADFLCQVCKCFMTASSWLICASCHSLSMMHPLECQLKTIGLGVGIRYSPNKWIWITIWNGASRRC